MIPIPTKFSLVVGHGEGDKKLTAFDAALLDAGIGNMNLLRVSSVLPPGVFLRVFFSCQLDRCFQLPMDL